MRLIAEEVTHRFGAEEILHNASIEVRSGQAVAVVGPSGSGKSTLLSILGGILRPTEGAVRQTDDDGDMEQIDVAWILQTTNAFGHRTVTDNVRVGTLSRSLSKEERRERIDDAIDAVGLSHRVTARAKTLSGGELQRLAIARARVSRAPFVLADEPTGQIDQRMTTAVLDLLIDSRASAGLIVATHDPMVAERCDRVVAIRNGAIHPA